MIPVVARHEPVTCFRRISFAPGDDLLDALEYRALSLISTLVARAECLLLMWCAACVRLNLYLPVSSVASRREVHPVLPGTHNDFLWARYRSV